MNGRDVLEERQERRVVHQRAVRAGAARGGAGHGVRPGGIQLPGRARGGQQQPVQRLFEVAARQDRVAVLVGQRLALLGDAQPRVDGPRRLPEDRAAGRATPTADAGAAPVEEAPAHPGAAAHVADLPLRLVQRPVRREEARVLVAVAVAQHDLLHVPAQHRAVLGQRQQLPHDLRRPLEVVQRLEQRHGQDAQAHLACQDQRFEHVTDRLGHADHVPPERARPGAAHRVPHLPDRPHGRLQGVGQRLPGRPQRAARAQLPDQEFLLGMLGQRRVVGLHARGAQQLRDRRARLRAVLAHVQAHEMLPEHPRDRQQRRQQLLRRAPLPVRDQAGFQGLQATHQIQRLPVPHRVEQALKLLAVRFLALVLLAEVRERLPDQPQQHLARPLAVQRQRLPRRLRRHERVPVPVPAHPRREAQRQRRRRVPPEHLPERRVQIPLQRREGLRDARHVRQAALHLVQHGRFQAAQFRRAPQRLHVRGDPRRLRPVHAPVTEGRNGARHLLQVTAHRAAAHLGRVRRERQAQVQPSQERLDLLGREALRAEFLHRLRQTLRPYPTRRRQHPHPLVLLGQVHQLEVPRERPRQIPRVRPGQPRQHRAQLRVAAPGPHLAHQGARALHQLEERLALLFPQHLTQRAAQQVHITPNAHAHSLQPAGKRSRQRFLRCASGRTARPPASLQTAAHCGSSLRSGQFSFRKDTVKRADHRSPALPRNGTVQSPQPGCPLSGQRRHSVPPGRPPRRTGADARSRSARSGRADHCR